jgi:D-beta-D-heptose 7-phosphate kinase/D-beta-D-heptose 1-phosphate adenosyltransferase
MSLSELAGRFSGHRITVVGDVMLDHFVVGQVDRISPEAPVPVVRFSRDEFRLGGAANVAHNVATLGGRARLVGLVGNDATAEQLREELAAAGLEGMHLVADDSRPTTRKVRVVTQRNQQVARVDYESNGPAGSAALDKLIAAVTSAVGDSDAIVLSDYRKGVIVPAVIEATIAMAARAGVPVLVDPKVPQAERYKGATLITPNHHEAELMTQTTIQDIDDAARAAKALHERTGASVIITWGEHGMYVFDRTTPDTTASIPAATREVADVTGAGDTVIAVLALGLASGAPLGDAARLANLAAGLVVGRFGPAAVSAVDLTRAAGDVRD